MGPAMATPEDLNSDLTGQDLRKWDSGQVHTMNIKARSSNIAVTPKSITFSIRQVTNEYLGLKKISLVTLQYSQPGQTYDYNVLMDTLKAYEQDIGKPKNDTLYLAVFTSPTQRWGVSNSASLSSVIDTIAASGRLHAVLTLEPWLYISAVPHAPRPDVASPAPVASVPMSFPQPKFVRSPVRSGSTEFPSPGLGLFPTPTSVVSSPMMNISAYRPTLANAHSPGQTFAFPSPARPAPMNIPQYSAGRSDAPAVAKSDSETHYLTLSSAAPPAPASSENPSTVPMDYMDSKDPRLDGLMRQIEDHSRGPVAQEDTPSPKASRKRKQQHHQDNNEDHQPRARKVKGVGSRKPRAPRPKLVKWDEHDWKTLCLRMVWACGQAGIDIPFEEAAKFVGPTVTAGATQQAILKLRDQQLDYGFDIPALRMKWNRKKKSTEGSRENSEEQDRSSLSPKGT